MCDFQHESDDRTANLSCGIRSQITERAQIAARLLGQSITDFQNRVLDEKAQYVSAEKERIVLSVQAFQQVVAVIFGEFGEPEKPTKKLGSAVEQYK